MSLAQDRSLDLLTSNPAATMPRMPPPMVEKFWEIFAPVRSLFYMVNHIFVHFLTIKRNLETLLLRRGMMGSVCVEVGGGWGCTFVCVRV